MSCVNEYEMESKFSFGCSEFLSEIGFCKSQKVKKWKYETTALIQIKLLTAEIVTFDVLMVSARAEQHYLALYHWAMKLYRYFVRIAKNFLKAVDNRNHPLGDLWGRSRPPKISYL